MKQQEIYRPSKKRTLEEGVRFGERCRDYYALPAPRHPNIFIRTFTHTSSSEPHCRSRGGMAHAGPIPVKASSHRSLQRHAAQRPASNAMEWWETRISREVCVSVAVTERRA
jgi:hypothetical protein